jgi:hypothetical protein
MCKNSSWVQNFERIFCFVIFSYLCRLFNFLIFQENAKDENKLGREEAF